MKNILLICLIILFIIGNIIMTKGIYGLYSTYNSIDMGFEAYFQYRELQHHYFMGGALMIILSFLGAFIVIPMREQ